MLERVLNKNVLSSRQRTCGQDSKQVGRHSGKQTSLGANPPFSSANQLTAGSHQRLCQRLLCSLPGLESVSGIAGLARITAQLSALLVTRETSPRLEPRADVPNRSRATSVVMRRASISPRPTRRSRFKVPTRLARRHDHGGEAAGRLELAHEEDAGPVFPAS